MSRSYRKPYGTFCVASARLSAAHDKQLASRGYRRLANRYLKHNWDNEEFLIPDLYEATHNDEWGWNRDGHKRLMESQMDRAWSRHCLALLGAFYHECWLEWPDPWYEKIKRK